jgi:hypothetical protein
MDKYPTFCTMVWLNEAKRPLVLSIKDSKSVANVKRDVKMVVLQ